MLIGSRPLKLKKKLRFTVIIVMQLMWKNLKKRMKLKRKNKTAVLTVLEVWSSGGITRAVIWDSIRGLITLEHVRRNV